MSDVSQSSDPSDSTTPSGPKLSRRTVLRAAAVSAGGVALAACGSSGSSGGSGPGGTAGGAATTAKGSSKEPVARPAAFQESPTLADQAKSGKIPALADRLPEEPYVIPHKWVQPGKYGGVMRMNITATSGGDASSVGEFFYSHSMLRYLNDGQDIGPGVVTKWTSNPDTSVWTFTMRKGLKWSDGHPVSTDDVLFWWKYMANDPDYVPESVPDEGKSGKGTICKLEAKDDLTFTMTFDAPAPLTADRLTMWTNGPGGNGPSWIVPAHYVKNFHPAFNKNASASWAAVGGSWEQNCSYKRSPKCPTLTPFMLTKYNEARSLTWAPNPYAYEVMPNGDQLPYLDSIVMSAVVDPQVGKVQITSGKVDFVFGPFNNLVMADVSTLIKNKKRADIDVYLWDGGGGAIGTVIPSMDYYEKPYRDLFAKPEFRQALSLASNRPEAQKALYFEQGELTTGTMSPKASEYLVNDTGKSAYASWRDSWVKFDPEKAKSMLDALGLKDTDGDGYREFADGSKLTLRTDRPANVADDIKAKDAQMVRDWKAVGIKFTINPVSPTSFDANWTTGRYMLRTDWGIGDGPNHLVYPQWVVPIESTRWSPLVGAMYNARGTKVYTTEADVDPWKRHPPRLMPQKGDPRLELWNLYDSTKAQPDFMKRTRVVWEMIKIHVKTGPYVQALVANIPYPTVKKTGLRNVPMKENLALGGFSDPWIHPTPAVYDPQTFYWDSPDEHKL